jgi:hypothetical protein
MYPRRGCIGYEFLWKHVFLALKKYKDLQEVIISTPKKELAKVSSRTFWGN